MPLNLPLPSANFGSGLAEGMAARSEMLDRLMKQKIAQQASDRAQQLQPYEMQLKEAQANREAAKANLPLGGETLPGPAGELLGLEQIKKLYGENSPQYKNAKAAYDLKQKSTQSRVNYEDILANSANKRFSTTLGKTVQEQNDIKNGFLPGTNIPLTDDQKKQLEGEYGLAIIKPTTDADTRKRNLYAKNIDITLGNINPDDLTQYSGIQGIGKLAYDSSLDLQGKTPDRYKAYQKSITAAKTLAKQVRQFYGDSISPAIQEGLSDLTNPASWRKSPEIAKSNFNAFVNLLRSEAKTYQEATQSPAVYSGNTSAPANSNVKTYNPKTGRLE